MKRNLKTTWTGVLTAIAGLLAVLYPTKKEVFGAASMVGIALLGAFSQDAGKE